MTKLLSIDSSTVSTGYAVFENGQYCRSGCINLKSIKDVDKKFATMIRELFLLLEKEKPDVLVVEEMVVFRNAMAARKLTMILGALYGKCLETNTQWVALRPTQWRKLVDPGKKPARREDLKEWSKQKVFENYGITDINDDVSDAVLIGQAYINQQIGGKTN